ncbi:MAG: NAD(P)H-binding protein [Chloroflexi bacterium]|nr:NAD(P)H-binding protein [Chloroflexota bacterium]
MNALAHPRVLVAGGTGHYGRYIVQSLLAQGVPVRVLTRNAGSARRLLGEAPELVEGDITDPPARRAALQGMDALVIAVSAMSPRLVRKTKEIEGDAVQALLAEGAQQSVRRVVYLSVYEVKEEISERVDLASGDAKVRVERALARSGLSWTVLGCAPSMQIFFAMIRGDTMMVPGGGPPALPTISALDVGEIAAQATLRSDLSGRRFRLVGPEAIGFREAARRISRVAGRPIGFRRIPLALPLLVRGLVRPLTPLSDRLLYVYQMLGFVELLNRFPPEIASEAPQAHRLLLETFSYRPTTLEMEARRWLRGPGQGRDLASTTTSSPA